MTILLDDNTPRESYTVAEGVTQTQFTVPFEFFDDADLNFYVDGTLKTLPTHYTVTGGNGSTGTINTTVGNSVTGIAGGSTVVITRSIALERTTDFPSSGAFEVATLNTELDRFTAIAAEISDDNDRSIHLADDDATVSMELPSKANRLGKVLGFNATTGAVEAGPTIADVSSLSAITADISTLADIEDGTDATDAIQTVATVSGDVTTVAGVSGQVTIVAGETTNLQNVTDNLSAIQNASANATLAENYAIKTDGTVETSPDTHSSKAWAIGGTGINDTNGAGSAKDWATDTTNTVDGQDYSAKEFAIGTQSGQTDGSAKQWAIGGGAGFDRDTAVSGSEYSAKYWANQAANSAQGQRDIYYGGFTSDAAAETYQTGTNLGTVDAGDLYFNTTTSKVKYYDGSAWNNIEAVDTSSFAGQGFAVAMAIAL